MVAGVSDMLVVGVSMVVVVPGVDEVVVVESGVEKRVKEGSEVVGEG